MKREEIFNALKKVILGEGKKELMFDVKTTDGKILRIEGDVLQKGLDAYLVLEDGTVGAVNDGDYILETGETVNISGGRVADFIPVSVEEVPVEDVPVEEVPVEEVPTEEAPAETTPIAEIPVEDIPAEMDWNEAVKVLAEEIAILKEQIGVMAASAQEMKDHVSQFSKLPTEDGIKKEKAGFKSEIEKTNDLRLSNLEKIKALRTQNINN
jgi:hypothetical protein